MIGKKLKIGFIGCGNIAGPYADNIKPHADKIEFSGFFDQDLKRSQEFAAKYGGKAYASMEALLADPDIDAAINLTPATAHAAVTKKCLEAGKHVHSEKPLAMTYPEALSLVQLAKAKKLLLSCSPLTWMGEGPQTLWKLIRENKVGTVRLIYAEMNHGRIESWHPAPQIFYEVGPVYDVGVYQLAMITAYWGPAKKVTAYGKVLMPDRKTKEGVPFKLSTPDHYTANIELSCGILVRLTTNFYVDHPTTHQDGMEIHGDQGSLALVDWNKVVEYAPFGKKFEAVPVLQEAGEKIGWARSVLDLKDALDEGRPVRASGEHAAHLSELINAIQESAKTGQSFELKSTFPQAPCMPWAKP
jgi:predicted dehydrogenase